MIIKNKKKIFVLNLENEIQKFSKLKIKKKRICLHKTEKDLIQESIIFTKGFIYFRTHKHPYKKPESYHLIKGKLLIVIFDNHNKVKKKIILKKNKNYPDIYKMNVNSFHLVIPMSKICVWHEVSSGPFKKNKSFIIYEKNAPQIKDSKKKQFDYCKKFFL
ncbi:WbuC family cupin fold metalloprotein [Candidatus Pelagibacter sp.]|nr:WbuC family cupin fold metalloprotein [Candidatus Pelagibacter sp.]